MAVRLADLVDGGQHTVAVTNPPQVPPQPQPVYLAPSRPPTSGLAVTALVFGIIGLVTAICTFGVPSLLAVAFGHAARWEIRRSGKAGEHFAKAGLWLGYPVLVLMVAFFAAEAAGIKP